MSDQGFDQELNLKAIFRFGLGLSILLVGCGAVVWMLSSVLRDMEEAKDPPPAAMQQMQYTPPAPLLQTDPLEDIAKLRALEEEALTTYGWVDRERGIARIPISRALELSAVDKGAGEPE